MASISNLPLMRRVHQDRTLPCLILDGGMGTTLEKEETFKSRLDVWTTTMKMSEKHVRECVKRAHLQFLEGGADIITTNTYSLYNTVLQHSAGAHALSTFDLGPLSAGSDSTYTNIDDVIAENENIWAKWTCEGIDVANEAVEEYIAGLDEQIERPLLAVSVGSFATLLFERPESANREYAPGEESKFKRDKGYGYSAHTLRTYLNTRLSDGVLAHAVSSGASILAFETVGDLLEVQEICEVVQRKSHKLGEMGVWVTLTCLTEHLVDTGDTFRSCVEVLAGCSVVAGIGVNCTEPKLVKPLLGTLRTVLEERGASDKLIVVYPNSGELYLCRELDEGETEHWKQGEEFEEWVFEDAAQEWISCGANVVGGCCRIYASQIGRLADIVKDNRRL